MGWYKVYNDHEIPTPALLVYPDRIEENIRRMIKIAGSPEKLRPHVKTHKMQEVVRLQVRYGINKFKCSTIAEAGMVAASGGKDVLLAMQPVGIQIDRFFQLIEKYPGVQFSTIADNEEIVEKIAQIAKNRNRTIGLWPDINNGMNRTGMAPGKPALRLYNIIADTENLKICGLHVYDGHIHDRALIDRHVRCENDFEPVRQLISEIVKAGHEKPVIVAGGTPTFPIHAKHENTELSPGTCLLWDNGYEEKFPDLDFLQAAVLLTSVVSKPSENLLCMDLGHKSVAAEMPHPRVKFFGLKVNGFVNHSEEHLVIDTDDTGRYKCGDLLYCVPRHICPTVPRYSSALVVKDGEIVGEWKIDARDRN